jgi:GcrA cell cycle regulator
MVKNVNNFWTAKNINKLKTMWVKNKTAADIATALGDGVTRNAVIGKANRLGLPKRPSPIKTTVSSKKVVVKKVPQENVVVDTEVLIKHKKGSFSILDIKENMCRYPIGDPKDENFHFCGKKALEDNPYCQAHSDIVYQQKKKRN